MIRSFLFGCVATLHVTRSLRSDPTSFFGGVNHAPYTEWLSERGALSFEHSVFVDSAFDETTGAALHWSIDETSIRLAIAVRAHGWVGFGLSENGGMRGADMLLFEAAKPNKLTDAHVLDDLNPIEDSCQNWELTHSQIDDDGFIIVEATRLLDTGDPQDHKITDDYLTLSSPHRVIAAWGDSDSWSYHGHNVAKRDIRFHGGGDVEAIFVEEMGDEAEGSFVMGASDFLIPNVETTYQDFCFSAQDLEAQGVPMNESLHVIGFEPLIDPRATKYVHHFTVRSAEGETCESEIAYEIVYGWTPGTGPRSYPPFLGSPLGVDGLTFYTIQLHYNNPDFDEGHMDSSGIRVYWTTKKREHDIGVFSLGDPRTNLVGESVGSGLSKHEFNCPASCTSMALSVDEPITVTESTFHMHEKGRKASIEVIREGDVIRTDGVDFFDFRQSGAQESRQEGTFGLLPGDSFRSTCYYDSPDDSHSFGFSSQEEMCITSFQYYPRRKLLNRIGLVCGFGFPLSACATDHVPLFLGNTTELGRTFGREADEGTMCLKHDHTDDGHGLSGGSAATGITGVASLMISFMLTWMWSSGL